MSYFKLEKKPIKCSLFRQILSDIKQAYTEGDFKGAILNTENTKEDVLLCKLNNDHSILF